MRYLVCIALFFVYSNAMAQGSEKSLTIAVDGFTNALVERDSVELKKLVDDKLVYGHSNGWQQSKKELINDLYNGKIIYKNLNQSDEQVTMDGNTACVRATLNIDVVMDGKPLQLKLHVLQVWIWKNKKWLMLSRQSTKI
jgi:hypothetical protein